MISCVVGGETYSKLKKPFIHEIRSKMYRLPARIIKELAEELEMQTDTGAVYLNRRTGSI
jgi:hypothetical protein